MFFSVEEDHFDDAPASWQRDRAPKVTAGHQNQTNFHDPLTHRSTSRTRANSASDWLSTRLTARPAAETYSQPSSSTQLSSVAVSWPPDGPPSRCGRHGACTPPRYRCDTDAKPECLFEERNHVRREQLQHSASSGKLG